MVRIAVLGCGRIGRMHAANIAAHARSTLAGVYDVHGPAAQDVAATHGVPVLASAAAVFAAAEIDAVLIATSTDTHADFIEQAVAAGKPVLCEKPIDLSLARVRDCAARIEGSGVPIQLGFNRRFDAGHRAARDAVRAGEIGDLHQVIVTSRDPAMPPRAYYEAAGGLLRDMTIHDFDLARFMLGDEPVEVFAMAGGLIDPALMDSLGDHDTAMILLRTAAGVQCHINNSRTAVYGYDQRVEALGTTGMVVSGNRKPHEMRRFGAGGVETGAPYEFFFTERYGAAFAAQIDAFVDAIETGTAPEVGFEDGHRALALAEAAYLSLSERRMVRVEEVM
ncbi:MAG: inositol 2-dehydrogenase [Alphaproteobacteria bacterium]|jgi:myo-inositol 2-dehydrogenase/D-chiro-inositol 1-dehydrogenase|nr:inositol 2-dehydrogenase [Alphaproteobacteria bacterium]